MIELQDISKEYQIGETVSKVLVDIDLKIEDGEYLGILGSSGSGKSTLMHIIGLLDAPSSGKLNFEGQNVATFSDEKLSKLRNQHVGFVFQQFNLINKLTVKENILLPSTYSRKKLDYSVSNYADELMNKFGIFERSDYYPNKISGGQQQRVAIARALIMKPKVVLADEPTGNLDSKTGEEILSLIDELNDDLGVTIVMVTHEKIVAKRTRRQVHLKDGKIISNPKH